MPKLNINLLQNKKVLIITLLAIAVVVLVAVLFLLSRKSDAPALNQNSAQQNEVQTQEDDPGIIRMLATGDWIAHDAINAEARQEDGSYDYEAMLAGMRPAFAAADINFCNVATLAAGTQFGVTGYPIFNAPTSWLDTMNGLGCNLYNTGTNHTNDKGQTPISAQLDYIDGLSKLLAHAGSNRSAEEQNQVRYFEVKGVKFAFLSYSTYSNQPNPVLYSLNRFEEPLVTQQMNEARANADIVIVSMRWGTEYSSGINAAQEQAANKLASLGADIVLGHGQHVLGPVKRLAGLDGREAIVWYGLGNFLNAQLETEALTGCVAQFDIDTTAKKVVQTSCLPFYQHFEWSAEDKAAERLLNRSNFVIMPLFDADEYLARPNAHLETTVEAQMERIRGVVNNFTEVPVQNARDL